MSATSTEVKIKIINFIEIAYKANGKLTTSLIKDVGSFTLSVDNKGNASLSGRAGTVKFSVSEEIKEYGLRFKYASVMFSGNRDGVIVYKASVGIGAEIIVSGVLDVEKLILNCSGLLCIAARAMRNRAKMIDKTINASLGK